MRKEYDFSKAKPVKDFPELARFQEEMKGKTRVTIMLDNYVIAIFKAMAKAENIGYQTLINQTLRRGLGDPPLDEEPLRSVIREELGRYAISEQPDPD